MINTANEELQNAFYRHLFQYNQSTYQQEGLSYHQVNFKDNRKTVDLLLEVSLYWSYIDFYINNANKSF